MTNAAGITRLSRAPIAAIIFAGGLAACTVGPDFLHPKPDVPASWSVDTMKQAAKAASTISSAAPEGDAWWERFRDPVLSSLIVRARLANLDLREAALRIAEARAQREIAAADQLPSLSGNASYANQRISETTAQGSLFGSFGKLGGNLPANIPSFPNPYNQYQIGFDASWEPDLFGGVKRSVEAAGADTEASQEDAHDALVSLEGEIARVYIDLRSAQDQAAILERNLATQQAILTLARQRRSAGLGTDLDVTNAAAQREQTRSQLPPLWRTASSDINQLSQLLAREPGALQNELHEVKPVPRVPAEVRVGLPGDLARRRADIRGAEARLHAATARVGVAVAALFPNVTFNANFGTQAESFPNLAEWASRFYSIGPSLELPIFEGGRLRATVHLADIREKEAAVDYARTVLNALHEVENAIVAFGTEQKRRSALVATLSKDRDALSLARDRYRAGVTSFLDVLDAERTAQQTELDLAGSTAAVSTDLVAVYKALGGGWGQSQDGTVVATKH